MYEVLVSLPQQARASVVLLLRIVVNQEARDWMTDSAIIFIEVCHCKKTHDLACAQKFKMRCAHKSDAAAVRANLKAMSELITIYLYQVS
jgi:hypothetical protein